MLTISKPTLFSPDGLAARGQCNHDSPGWQLRWFDRTTPATMVWQGAFKTCRHLQMSCVKAGSLDEVRRMVEELLGSHTLSQQASHPTDAYPTPTRAESLLRDGDSGTTSKKKRKKKRH